MSALAAATGFRHGIVLPPQRVRRGASDPRGLFNVAIPSPPGSPWKSAAGGIGRTLEDAEAAAVGEALERYAASACAPAERVSDNVPVRLLAFEDFAAYRDSANVAGARDEPVTYVSAHSALDNEEIWVPAELVLLRPGGHGVATSSGLAAAASRIEALLRAIQELVERDALAVTWAQGVPGRRIPLPDSYVGPVRELGGDVTCIDATPAFSPHPVAFVTGQIPLRGRPRYSLGAACRATWSGAVEKAYLEWIQGVEFVGTYRALNPDALPGRADEVRSFDDHAVFFSANPLRWAEVPLLHGPPSEPPPEGRETTPAEALHEIVVALHAAGIRVLYRDLTTRDLRQLGVAVVRALSPDLAPIWSDHRRRYLSGPVRDVGRRYPWVDDADLRFPSPLPHPLG